MTRSTTKKSETVTDKVSHPVAFFLGSLGFDVSNFPRISVLFETTEHIFKSTQAHCLIRIPRETKLIFKSLARIKSILEVPNAKGSGHRKFIELEWYIDEQGILEEENHPVLFFLSSEVECPKCTALFIPDADIPNDNTLELSCPGCLSRWRLRVESPVLQEPKVELLADVFSKDPKQVEDLLNSWNKSISASQALEGNGRERFFRTHFEKLEGGSNLDWFFGDSPVFSQVTSSCDGDFELLFKSFLNTLFEKHLSLTLHSTKTLDQTEVFRKSEMTRRDEISNELFYEDSVGSFSPFEGQTDVRTLTDFEQINQNSINQKDFQFSAPPFYSESTEARRSLSKPSSPPPPVLLIASLVASTILFACISIVLLLKDSNQTVAADHKTSSSDMVKSDVVISDIAKKEAIASVKEIQEITEPLSISSNLERPILPVEVEVTSSAASEVKEAKERVNQDLREIEDKRENAIQTKYQEGLQLFNQENYAQAILSFQEVVSLDPRHVEGHRNLGLAFVYSERYDEGRKSLETYLNLASEVNDDMKAHVRQVLGFIDSWSQE